MRFFLLRRLGSFILIGREVLIRGNRARLAQSLIYEVGAPGLWDNHWPTAHTESYLFISDDTDVVP